MLQNQFQAIHDSVASYASSKHDLAEAIKAELPDIWAAALLVRQSEENAVGFLMNTYTQGRSLLDFATSSDEGHQWALEELRKIHINMSNELT